MHIYIINNLFRNKEFKTVLDIETITNKASVMSQLSAQCSKSGMLIAQAIDEKVTEYDILYFTGGVRDAPPKKFLALFGQSIHLGKDYLNPNQKLKIFMIF